VNRNPYSQTHRHNVYNPATNYYPQIGNTHFGEHIAK
jgi:hypothetical protein